MTKPQFVPLSGYEDVDPDEMITASAMFLDKMRKRRTIRDFSDAPIPREVIENAIATASTAPSGANMQPWHFAVVTDPQIKKDIRFAAEEEEKAFYQERASDEWLEALAPLGTDDSKPFLETAPYLIVVFQQNYGVDESGNRKKHYYVQESVGIATGMLITALHNIGLATLTHTPSPMGFLREVLGRPKNERATMILVVGKPQSGAQVPNIGKKSLDEICSFV